MSARSEPVTRPKKVAVVWVEGSRLVDLSVRHELYVRGFQSLGHEVLTVCRAEAAEEYAYPTIPFGTEGVTSADFWKQCGFDVAVMITWHRFPGILAAMRSAGTRTIAIGDSDGQVSERVFPCEALSKLTATQPKWHLKARAVKAWAVRVACGRAGAADQVVVDSTRQSDVVVIGTEAARTNFERILRSVQAAELIPRLIVAPYPVHETFIDRPVCAKLNRLLAVARWDSPQKDGPLMRDTLANYYQLGGTAETTIVGRGGQALFRDLCRDYPQIQYLDIQPPEVVAELMAEARSIVFSSRWEGASVAAWEMLSLGGTVVGPPIPNLTSLVGSHSRFGRVSRSRRPGDLAAAIRDEIAAWDSGLRAPEAIAGHWRPQLRPTAVCKAMLDALAPGNECRCSPNSNA
jgi:hypothetical protein